MFIATAEELGIQPVIAPIGEIADVERGIETLAQEPNGGLPFPSDLSILARRDLVVDAAARHRLPAVYADRAMVFGGGRISFSSDRKYLFRR